MDQHCARDVVAQGFLQVDMAFGHAAGNRVAHEVVVHDFMRDTIARRMAQGHIHLQETLCDDVVRAMLAHPQVRAVRVSTMKPDVYPDCEGVGVEVFQIKDDV